MPRSLNGQQSDAGSFEVPSLSRSDSSSSARSWADLKEAGGENGGQLGLHRE